MGFNVQSEQTKQVQASFTNIVNTAVVNLQNSANVSCSGSQEFIVNIGDIPGGTYNGVVYPPQTCPVTITNSSVTVTQNQSQNCDLNANFTNDVNIQFTQNLANTIEQWINNNFTSYTGWLSIAFNSQAANNISIQQVATDIANNVSANIRNTCGAQLATNQRAQITLCGIYNNDTINLNQQSFITNVTSCLSSNTLNYIANNTQLNGMAQTADNELSSKQEGPLDTIRWVLIAIVVIAVLAIIGFVIYLIFSSKSSPQLNPAEQRKRELQRELILEKLQGEEGGSVSAMEGGGGTQNESTLGRLARMGGEYFSRREEV